jgi:AcrR family transcriptional regulator
MTEVTSPLTTQDTDQSDPRPARRSTPFDSLRPAVHRERNPRGEGERLRRELLEHGLELLSEATHPDEVSIRAIARRTGVSPTAAYRHFVDRDDLVYCAIGLAFQDFAAHLTAEVAAESDPFDSLAAAGRAYRRYAEQQPGRYRVMFSNPMACPDTTTATVEEIDVVRDSFGLLVSLVQACLDAGAPATTSGHPAEYLAFQMWTWIHGISDLRITHSDIEWPDTEEMFADAQRLLGLARPD